MLHVLPEGKLLLKTKELSAIGNHQRILGAMAGHGIPPDRIELQVGYVSGECYIEMFNRRLVR